MILDRALHAGLRVDAVRCGEPEPFLDIGTPADLVLATRRALADLGSEGS